MNFHNRTSGIPPIAQLPWGSHFCQFYQSSDDLCDLLLPYLKAGLENNELCVWLMSEGPGDEGSYPSLKESAFQHYLGRGQLQLISFRQWETLRQRSGNAVIALLDNALLRGFDGIRVGCTALADLPLEHTLTPAEQEAVTTNNVLALFAYPREDFDASKLMDMVKQFHFALVRNGSQWDIIESHEAKVVRDELRRSQEKFRLLFSNMSSGFAFHRMVLDAAGYPVDYVFLEVNDTFLELAALGGQDVIGKRVTALLPGIEKDSTDWIGIYGKVALTAEPVQFESYSETLGRWFDISAFSPQRGYFAVTVNDITRRKAAEAENLKLNEELKARLVELSSANGSLRDSRRAALNLMEDAVLARRDAERAMTELRRSNQHLDLLAQTTADLLKSDSPQDIVESLCHRVLSFLDCQVFFNFLVDEEAGRLRLNACAGIPDEEAALIEWLDYGVAVCGCAARDACRIVADDIQHSSDPRVELVKSYGITAYACHPLMVQGVVYGTLSFGTSARPSFTSEELALMKAVADQVSIAMERQWSEEALRRAHDELEQRIVTRTRELATTVDTLRREIAERELAEAKLLRLNRLHAVLSETDQAIIRAKDRYSLFRDFCRIATEEGGFLLAWVGVVDEDGVVHQVASSGATGYLDAIRITVSPEPEGAGPTGISVRQGTYYICNDFQNDPVTAPWHEKGREHGIQASASIALKEEGRVIGSLTLYASEKDAFDQQHVGLLRQMGADISFALENLLREERRRKAEQALQEETLERLRAVEDLREKERLLIQQSRQAAMGEMIGNIAHQWRQPLNTLGLMVQELAMCYELGDFNQDYLDNSVNGVMQLVSHMSHTIDDFRNFFKPDKEKVEFQVRQVIDNAISIVAASLKENHINVRVTTCGNPLIHGYPNEYSQVLLNILLNARDALSDREIEDRRIEVQLGEEEGKSVVTVRDNAGGIAAEILEKIFDPYFTTKGPDKGTGVGLYMSKAIIEKNMNGRLTAHNVADGALFRIEV